MGVAGTGVIGASWAAHFLRQGFDVVAFDPAPGAAAKLRERIDRAWPVLDRMGLRSGASPDRVSFTEQLSGLTDVADFVLENAPEVLGMKQQLIAELDEAADEDVIIASSSSGIVPSALQERCMRAPQRVLVAHPFQPPHIMPLVEVVGGARTSHQVIARTMDFLRSTGKRPIHLTSEVPGHVVNRLQAALWREAYSLVERGVVSVGEVDDAIRFGPGLRWALLGPFLTLHLTGGDGGIDRIHRHLGGTMQTLWADFATPDLDEQLTRRVSEGVAAELDGASAIDIERWRDEALVELLQLHEAHGEDHGTSEVDRGA